jgi:hypothetical protein
MTNKKLIVGALSLMATLLLATASFGSTCGSGIDVHYVGIGSSAEFQTLGFGANDAIQHLSTYTAPTNIWSNTGAQVIDARTGVNTIDTGLKIWVFYDSSETCNVYVGYQADSVQGNKDFFCYGKVPAGYLGVEANCYGHTTGAGSWEQANSGGNVIFGLPDVPTATPLPAPIQTFLVTAPRSHQGRLGAATGAGLLRPKRFTQRQDRVLLLQRGPHRHSPRGRTLRHNSRVEFL